MSNKHEATYHGGEYVPSTEIVRLLFKIGRVTRKSDVGTEQMNAEFDRWLATVKAEAWDEAYTQGRQDQSEHGMYHEVHTDNPYRRES